MKVYVSTFPFGESDSQSVELLRKHSIDYTLNSYRRKLTESELQNVIASYDALIAGTEPITKSVIESGQRLQLISRVGIGLDNIDLEAARASRIRVSYTPDAPSPAVAELTIGLMLSLLRFIHQSNEQMKKGYWYRRVGQRLSECVIGILGVGRIGKRVINHLEAFGCKHLFLYDIDKSIEIDTKLPYSWVDWETLISKSDVLTIHVPLTSATENIIASSELNKMKPDSLLINTARGGIVNEKNLYDVMVCGHLAGAAIDVFSQEPYSGPLTELDRCILTAHMGSMSFDCRRVMEEQAVMEVIRLNAGESLQNLVPEEEYNLQLTRKY